MFTIRLLTAATFAACMAAPASAQQVTLMTGPQGGSWVPLGGALKGLWEKAVPGLAIQQQPGAGIANVRGVDEGKAQIGFANSSTTVDGIAGRAPYPKAVKNVCQVANLYPQYFQVVASADAKVNSYADFKGKTLVTQPKGNTAEILTAMVLEINGMNYQSLAKANFQAAYTDAVSMMKDGHAQVFTLGTTAPASAVMDLASARDVTLVPVDDKTMDAEEGQPRLQQADHQGRHLPQAGQGRAGDRVFDAHRRRLRLAGRHGLQDDQGDGRERRCDGRGGQADHRPDAEGHGDRHRRAAAQGRREVLQGKRRHLKRLD